ncbi:EAL domain-containing protein [Myxococcota bacterium]|nr:EAL domain-containing protein [Myxococcota bacterium]
MSVSRRIQWSIGLAVAGLVATVGAGVAAFVLAGARDAQTRALTEALVHARAAVTAELGHLSVSAGAFAGIDAAGLPALGPAQLAAAGIDALVVADPDGRPVVTTGSQDGHIGPVAPADVWDRARIELALRPGGQGPRTGLLVAGDAVFLVAAHPMPSEADAAGRASTLLLARRADGAHADRLRAVVGSSIGLHPLLGLAEFPDVQRGLPALMAGQPVAVVPTDDGRVAASTLFTDVGGRPAVVLRLVADATHRAFALETVAAVALGLLVLGLLFLGIVHWLARRLTSSLDALADSELARSFVEQTSEGIVLVDRTRGTIVRTNEAAQRMFGGLTPAEAAQWLGPLTSAPVDGGRAMAREVSLARPDGRNLDIEVAVHPLSNGHQRIVCAVLRDVSERKQVEQRIRHQAYHDGLTQLPNRALFNDRLGVSLAQARRARENVGVLLLDLDHFKTINDTMGHDLGDELLVQASDRIRRCVRDGDTIARLGGDEFVVLLPRLENPTQAGTVAERILNALRAPFGLGGREVHISSSIGVAVHPQDGDDASTLFRNADLAMYHAKQQGRNAWMLHDASMNEQAADLLELKTELLYALRNDELFLELQPQIAGATGELCGFEALVRWRSPKRGIVPPGRFIPVAEETGLILAVGEWVLRAACKQVRDWLDAGLPAVRIAVNFSARQFLERDLVERVERALNETGCPPELIEVEVTESIAMKHADRSVAALQAFRRMGMAVALDDFGTGYSSLAYLRQFPLDRLKMDRAFIKEMTAGDNSRTMVDSIISLSHSLGLEVCAEGVETPEQIAILRTLGCDLLQGFGLARPMPAHDATAIVRAEHPPRWASHFETLLPQESLSRLARVFTNVH